MSAATQTKDKAMAAYLKKMGVTRTTTACPHHCGAHPHVSSLLNHLQVCRGRQRAVGKSGTRVT